MNIYDNYDIEYDNVINKVSIKVISEENSFLGIFMEKDILILEVHYDKDLKNFVFLNGFLGKKLKDTDFSVELKLERVLEVFNNNLSDYFHPPVESNPITSPSSYKKIK